MWGKREDMCSLNYAFYSVKLPKKRTTNSINRDDDWGRDHKKLMFSKVNWLTPYNPQVVLRSHYICAIKSREREEVR